jgi:hypothetical protein
MNPRSVGLKYSNEFGRHDGAARTGYNATMFDYFIAAVAVVSGSALLIGGALNAAWLMQLTKVRGLAAGVGVTAARLICMAVGAAVILLGILVASGWRPSWAQSRLPLRSGSWQTAT